MIRLLVIGGTDGQVGFALSKLEPADIEIVVMGKPDLDMLDPPTMEEAIKQVKPHAVACVGAYTAVDQAETDRDICHRLNAEAPGHIARFCAARRLPLVHVSTDYVFDGTKAGPYLPTDQPNPQTVYGATKLGGEHAIAAAGGRHAILRTSWVYAPTGKNFVRTMLRTAKTRDKLPVVDDQTGYPTYAPHIAETIIAVARQLVEHPKAPSGVFHMVGEGTVTWRRFAEAIFEGSRARGGPGIPVEPITTAQYPTPAKRPANSVLDPTTLGAFGVKLPHWRVGLEHCLDAIAADGWNVA